ncbi:MAG: hypothetical protein OJJ21_12885 [Ferrovibrio sp.]|uniref:hypothetical protein n=1 Tax=Ferrovibrio sp. TaxID=1917215 RepID=UPI00262DD159|nr:hypothetical protein [Ferrovibrio sp.]MCW0234488.1 hypothetical protein [Ferrovibrio sp.]
MIKKIALAVAIVVIAIAGAAYYFASNIDSLVKAVVERYGSEATQTSVTLKAVKLSITDGSGELSALTVKNPKGFSSADAITLGDIRMALDISTLQSNTIVIKDVTILQPAVLYEYAGGGGNLETIQKNVQSYAAKFSGGKTTPDQSAGGSAGADKTASKQPEKKVIIENLVIRDGKIAMTHQALQGRTLSAPLPTIQLKDIGKDKGGATPAEVAEKVIGTISAQASRVATAELQKQVGTLLKDQAGGLLGGTGGGSTTGGSSPTDKLKGLLGK